MNEDMRWIFPNRKRSDTNNGKMTYQLKMNGMTPISMVVIIQYTKTTD